MSQCDFAIPAPPGYDSLGAFTSGPLKAVWHRTQGSSYAGAWSAYRDRRICPHFTIDTNGAVYQHFDTGVASFSLSNDAGGVQTNRDSVIQVEVVGFSGETMPSRQRDAVLRLKAWLEAEGVAPVWPMGRPPKNSHEGYGEDTPYRNAHTWDTTSGHYGHSNVPENEHWDPAWTDEDWSHLSPVVVKPTTITKEDMNKFTILVIVSDADRNKGLGFHLLGPNGLRSWVPTWDDFVAWDGAGVGRVTISETQLAQFAPAVAEAE